MTNQMTAKQIKSLEAATLKMAQASQAAKDAWEKYKATRGIETEEGRAAYFAAKEADKVANYAAGVWKRLSN